MTSISIQPVAKHFSEPVTVASASASVTHTDGILTAAVVVAFHPEPAILAQLLASLAPQVNYLFLVDNGGCDTLDPAIWSRHPHCRYLPLTKNFGLGYALNAGFERAKQLGVEFVATFDQDSTPPDNLIASILKQHLEFQMRGISCAAIGPVFYDRRETNKVFFPFYREQNASINTITIDENSPATIEVDVLITSGMMVKMSVWDAQMRYDDGMFVDYTDTEWCFRARSLGLHLFACTTVQMGHALSDAPPLRLFNLKFFHYSPLRRYYYFRNTLLFCKQSFVSKAWKKRLLMGLVLRIPVTLLYEKKPLTQLKMMVKGIWYGVRNLSGPYR